MILNDILPPDVQPEVLGQDYGFTEGPAADAQGNVFFSDGKNNSIYRWQPGLGVSRFVHDSTDPVGMMFNAVGELLVCEGAAQRIVAYNVATKEKRILCSEINGQHFNEPNDLAVDRTGGFYFSDPNYQHHGQPTVMKQDVYYCSNEGKLTRVSTVCFKPNGVLLAEDDLSLYVADARGQRIYRYDVPEPGQLDGERVWIDRLAANPDGLTLDQHQNLYVCCGKAGLKVFDCNGKPLGQINVHAANCCFGGCNFQTLCIASADRFLAIPTQVVGQKPLALRP